MRIDLTTVANIANDVASKANEKLEVVGVSPGTGDGSYTEIVMVVNGCRSEPCKISLGVFRDVSEPALRAQITEKLHEHLVSAH
jgi:hypothetical protein